MRRERRTTNAVVLACALFFSFASRIGGAASPATTGRVAVDVVAAPGSEPWFALALERTLARELARFHRVSVVPSLDRATCPRRENRCLIDAYAKAGTDIVVVGTLDSGALRYETFETWSGSIVSGGAIRVDGVIDNLDRLKSQMGRIVRPIVSNGGALDRKPVASDTRAPAPTAHPLIVAIILAGLLLFVASPLLLLRGLVSRADLFGRARPRSRLASYAILFALAAALAAWLVPAAHDALVPAPGLAAVLATVLPLAGGILWGWLVLLGSRLVFVRIHGIERIHPEAIPAILGSWCRIAAVRLVGLWAALAPAFVVARVLGSSLGLDARFSNMVLVPALGLLSCFWFLSLVDHLAVFLDVSAVAGPATEKNAWHRTMKRYLRGYVRRGGIDLTPGALDRFLLLPSRFGGVTCYGGGFSRPRILVEQKAMELALWPFPDEEELPERTVNFEEFPLGLIVPGSGDGAAAESLRKNADVAPARAHAPLPRAIGESATLLGWILPQKSEAGVPLIADSNEDFAVLRGLLTMHYSGFEKNLRDDEYDDSDPTQKDFLFGALLREIGRSLRGDALLETIRLAVVIQWERMSPPTRLLLGRFSALHARFFSGDLARVADAWVALNHGRDALMQVLFLESTGSEEGLTTRADSPLFFQRSKEIADAVAARPPEGAERQRRRGSLRNRILWLSDFLRTPVVDPSLARRAVRVRLALGSAAALVLLAIAVRSAVIYHPIYEARMREAEARVAAGAQRHEGEGNGN